MVTHLGTYLFINDNSNVCIMLLNVFETITDFV